MTRAEFIHACMATGRWKLREALEQASELAEDDDFPPFDDECEEEEDVALAMLLSRVDDVLATPVDSPDFAARLSALENARAAFATDDDEDDGA
jgi:hypothetical protein